MSTSARAMTWELWCLLHQHNWTMIVKKAAAITGNEMPEEKKKDIYEMKHG